MDSVDKSFSNCRIGLLRLLMDLMGNRRFTPDASELLSSVAAELTEFHSSQCQCSHWMRMWLVPDPSQLRRPRTPPEQTPRSSISGECRMHHASIQHRTGLHYLSGLFSNNISLLHQQQQHYTPLSESIKNYQKHVQLITI